MWCLVFLKSSVLGPLLFLLYFADLPPLLQKTLIGCVDDSTLVASASSLKERPVVAASSNRDQALINDWCNRRGMLINPSKTYGLIISRSKTIPPAFPGRIVFIPCIFTSKSFSTFSLGSLIKLTHHREKSNNLSRYQ